MRRPFSPETEPCSRSPFRSSCHISGECSAGAGEARVISCEDSARSSRSVACYDSLMIIFAADHRGYALKEEIKNFVLERYDSGAAQDAGALAEDPTDDYPDFAFLGAHAVAG